MNNREQRGLGNGGRMWVSQGLTVCSGRTWSLNPQQMNVQGLPRPRVGRRVGWKPFDPEPLPLGWRPPPLGLCAISCLPCGGGCSDREGAWLRTAQLGLTCGPLPAPLGTPGVSMLPSSPGHPHRNPCPFPKWMVWVSAELWGGGCWLPSLPSWSAICKA